MRAVNFENIMLLTMKAEIKTYEIEETQFINQLQFLFESVGQNKILKAIQYTNVMKFKNRDVYNLGFGDYDMRTGAINDEINSNNGDVYTVFNTVLSTVL
ncbi:MAG: hypothetical protein BGO52_09615 [Sphingobacteriales bacterium 44-61]|jgi:hypothetical protein|nr:MAG: hypothetical protein BGO52_09615 [Sphingobacteriales bacterium 44-61]